MARFPLGAPPTPERLAFALLRALAALIGTISVLLALLYSGYLRYTDVAPPEIDAPATAEVEADGRTARYHRSSLSRRGRLWTLALEGRPEELGDAHGHLLARTFLDLDTHVRRRIAARYGSFVDAWAATMLLRWDHRGADRPVAAPYLRELAALSAALPPIEEGDLDRYHELFLHQAFLDLGQRLEDVVVEGSFFAIADRPLQGGEGGGNLVIGRNLAVDLGRDYDPERVVSVYFPDGKYPFVSIGWAGLVGVVTGVNSRGLFVAANPARTDDPVEAGVPVPFVLRRVLEEADTLEQATEIVMAADLRTAATVLVADGSRRKAAVLELSPRARDDRRALRESDGDAIWATDHLVADAFDRDARNDWIRRSSASGYRHTRLGELLRAERVDPARAAAVLRDRRGLEGVSLGLGNPNALDDLALVQSVVVDLSSMMLWVGEGPSALGRYEAFDLRHLLGREGKRPAPLDDIPADPLLQSEEWRDYLEALEAVRYAESLLVHGMPERALASAKIALVLAPDLGDLHRLLGDIERTLGHGERAMAHYRRYLELLPGRLREQIRVEGILAELGG